MSPIIFFTKHTNYFIKTFFATILLMFLFINAGMQSIVIKGKVIDELEKGYTLNDKVIRFAKVVVGS